MKVSCEAFVEAPVEQVWRSLTDVDRVLAVVPGATLTRDDGSVTGSLKCILGSTQVTYRIAVRADSGAAGSHAALLAITGKEARGSGVLAASITVEARAVGAGTTIEISGEIEASGRGESADAETWANVVQTLLDAAAPHPEDLPPVTALTALLLALSQARWSRPLAFGLAGIIGLLLVRRRRRRTRR